MPRKASNQTTMSPELQEALNKVKEIKEREQGASKREEAEKTLTRYESEYEHAKEVFFAVNGARRILKGLTE